ncbi:zinc transporter ZIP4-like isoform X2 [Xyrauchen texanus]|uniref:zinc transporter ZIP4-like isoform X2 n=1 Tax=Xyrauchen texanus TaxID=154827 RepID=UPI002241E56E|nr:zinc transporter ZIP4-like isoform X2 [Xyrauchen texanus]
METIGVLALCFSLFSGAHGDKQDIYAKVVDLMSPGQEFLTEDAVRSVLGRLEERVQCSGVSCGKCLSVEVLPQLLSSYNTSQGLQMEDFFTMAPGCCLFLSGPPDTCRGIDEGRWSVQTQHFIETMLSHDNNTTPGNPPQSDIGATELESLERLFDSMEKYNRPDVHETCLSLNNILKESSTHDGDHTRTELDAVFGNIVYHVLRGDCMKTHVRPEQELFLDYIFNLFGSENLTLHNFEALLKTLNLGGEEHDYDHIDDEPHHSGKTRQQSHPDNNSSWDSTCFSAEDLLRIFHVNSSTTLTRDQFTQLSPALIQQILSGGCSQISTTPVANDPLSTVERYGYATLANIIICLMAMFGIVVLLFSTCTQVFDLCIQFCIGLAVGSLTGDALLHLLPAILSLHKHDDGHSQDHSEENFDYVYKLLVVIGGIYVFYLLETIFSIITRQDHHHHTGETEPHHCDHSKVLQLFQRRRQNNHSTSQAELVDTENNGKSVPGPTGPKREQRLLPYMITIGDAIHNFVDGLAMGAAFSVSWRSGLATSLAVLCHELPHELGDFAILLHCGLSVKNALLLNVASALTSFIGLYIALSVSTETVAPEWISAVTTGLFLYVGLADMLPTMIHVDSKRPWLVFLLQNLGLLCGWGILLLLSLYEEQIGV